MSVHPRDRLGRAVCAVLVVAQLALLTGCSSWNRMAPPKPGYATSPTRLSRITLDDQSQIQVHGLRVDGDTLRFAPAKGADSLHALAAIRMVGYEERHLNWVNTTLLVVGIAGTLYLGLLIAVVESGAASLTTQPTPETAAPEPPSAPPHTRPVRP
jgi:hypothetical protein